MAVLMVHVKTVVPPAPVVLVHVPAHKQAQQQIFSDWRISL
jgi:hypothetical protein